MKKIIILLSTLLLMSGCFSQFEPGEAKQEIKNDLNQFFNHMLLEEIDPIMDMIDEDSDLYYDFYTQTLSTFKKTSYDYEIKKISFEQLSEEKIIVDALVKTSGVNENGEQNEYKMLYTFDFIPGAKDRYKIENIDIQYNF